MKFLVTRSGVVSELILFVSVSHSEVNSKVNISKPFITTQGVFYYRLQKVGISFEKQVCANECSQKLGIIEIKKNEEEDILHIQVYMFLFPRNSNTSKMEVNYSMKRTDKGSHSCGTVFVLVTSE